jgi:hypothetical protein
MAAAVLLGLAAAGCAGMRSGVDSGVILGPSGRAEGRFHVPAGSRVNLRLANQGPGRADFVTRLSSGVVLQEGALDTAEVEFTPSAPVVLVVVLETYADAGTSVTWSLSGAPSADVDWDLSRAAR